MAEQLLWNADANVLGIFASPASNSAVIAAGLDATTAVRGESIAPPLLHPSLASAPRGELDPRLWNPTANAGLNPPDRGGAAMFM